jgi:hypothetical protein
MKHTLLLSLVISSASLAQSFRVVEPVALDLTRRREAALVQADVVVSVHTLDAPRGVRCGTASFEPRAVTTLDRDCEVRVASGETKWFRVSLEGADLVVRLRPEALDGPPRLVGEFVQRAVTINGLETQARFGALLLMEDGRYRIGRAEGRWSRRGAVLDFEGPIAHWSNAVVTDEGIRFTFVRGPLEYTITYAHAPAAREEEQRAAR